MSIYPLLTNSERVKYLREAASVKRCHTVPIIGEYNVGYHSFNMLAMLRILNPEASPKLIWAVVEHDMPERLTGDIPAPTKWFKIIDKDKLNIAEIDINETLFGEDIVQSLTQEELKWLKGLDILELYLFCKDQIVMGNSNMRIMKERIERFVKRESAFFAGPVVDFFYEVKDSEWNMMPDLGDI